MLIAKRPIFVTLMLCLGLLASTAQAQPNASTPIDLSLAANQPIDGGTGQILFDAQIVQNSGAEWVRINFLLGPWDHPTDTTLHSGRTWFETFDSIVNDAAAVV